MSPLAKNGDVALAKFYETETGKLALLDAVKSEHAAMQESARIGDADQYIAKFEKGETDIHHEHQGKHIPGKKKQKAKPGVVGEGVYGNSPDAAAGPNRPLNNTPFAPMGKRFASVCDGLAAEHAAQFGVTKDAAYTELLKTNRMFKVLWDNALTLPAE
jgi:hypothetical protein